MFGGLDVKAPVRKNDKLCHPLPQHQSSLSLSEESSFEFLQSNRDPKHTDNIVNNNIPQLGSTTSSLSKESRFDFLSIGNDVEEKKYTASHTISSTFPSCSDHTPSLNYNLSLLSTSPKEISSNPYSCSVIENPETDAKNNKSSMFSFLTSSINPTPVFVTSIKATNNCCNHKLSKDTKYNTPMLGQENPIPIPLDHTDVKDNNVTGVNEVSSGKWGPILTTTENYMNTILSSSLDRNKSKTEDDMTSLQSSSYPVGSGVVFGSATSAGRNQTIVKKKRSGRRFGTGALSLTSVSENTNDGATSFHNLSSRQIQSTNIHSEDCISMDHDASCSQKYSESKISLSDEAEDVARKAELFMMEKEKRLQKSVRMDVTTKVTGYYGSKLDSSYNSNRDENSVKDFTVPTILSRNNFTTSHGENILETPILLRNSDDAYAKAEAAAKQAVAQKKIFTSNRGSVFMSFFKKSSFCSSSRASFSPSDDYAGSKSKETSSLTEISDHQLTKIRSDQDTSNSGFSESECIFHDSTVEFDDKRAITEPSSSQTTVNVGEAKFSKSCKEVEQRKEKDVEKKHLEEIVLNNLMKRSPEKVLQKIISEFEMRTRQAMSEFGKLRDKRLSLINNCEKTKKDLRLASQQVIRVEGQQTDAAEAEDFDRADQLAAVIEQHTVERKRHEKHLEKINFQINMLNYKRESLFAQVTACFAVVTEHLNNFQKEQLELNRDDEAKTMVEFEATRKKLASENERLTVDIKNIVRDENFTAEERLDLEGTIYQQTEDIQNLRQIASKELKVVMKDIEDLKKKVSEKEIEAKDLVTEMTLHDSVISQVRNRFSRQLSRLEKKEAAVWESRHEWDIEHIAYMNVKEKHEEEVLAYSNALLAQEQIMFKIKAEADSAEMLTKVISEEVMYSGEVEQTEGESELSELQAEVVKFETVVDEAMENVDAVKAVILSLNNEIEGIKFRLPELIVEKKTAASRRDFKKAGRASKLIKDLTSKKNSCENQLTGVVAERYSKSMAELEFASDGLFLKKTTTREKERENAKKRMEFLAKKVIRLENKKTCLGIVKDEQTSGNVCKDIKDIIVVGKTVFDSEISALIREGVKVGNKFGGWTNILGEFYANENLKCNIGCDNKSSSDLKKKSDIQVENEEKEIKSENRDRINENYTIDKSYLLIQKNSNVHTNVEKDLSNENLLVKFDNGNCSAIMKYMGIKKRIKEINSTIDELITVEDYDKAADLDDELQKLAIELDSIQLTKREIESADSFKC